MNTEERKYRRRAILYLIAVICVCMLTAYVLHMWNVQLQMMQDIETQQQSDELILITDPSQEQNKPQGQEPQANQIVQIGAGGALDLSQIPAYSGKPYAVINNNEPFFTEEEITTKSYEKYSPLDNLGRCQACIACIGKDIMPSDKRGEISSVKPSGWVNNSYDFIDGNYVYNRCHLIGFQLAGENANDRNLITGTRYMNVQGMLPFENMVTDFVKESNEHVMYRVTPIYRGDNLVADGVLMEAMSVEDEGDSILFNVFCYNVQPGIVIDYATGKNWLDETPTEGIVETFIANKNSNKFHTEKCDNAAKISEKNKKVMNDTFQGMINKGYTPCSQCLGDRKT